MKKLFLMNIAMFMAFGCHQAVKGQGENTWYHVASCERIKTRLAPTVCGKCRLKQEEDKLLVIPAQDCPAYETYRCTTKEGKTFLINTLGCKPYEDKR